MSAGVIENRPSLDNNMSFGKNNLSNKKIFQLVVTALLCLRRFNPHTFDPFAIPSEVQNTPHKDGNQHRDVNYNQQNVFCCSALGVNKQQSYVPNGLNLWEV